MPNYGNYLVGENPFHLAGPPNYWLKALYDFDTSLVVMPSKQSFIYRVCMRRKPSFSVNVVNDIMKEDADSRMMAAHNLVPVTTLLATTNWSNFPLHMEELRRRTPHRMGGAEAYIKKLEQQEWEDELKQRQDFDNNVLAPLTKDAWNLYQKKIGVRSHMYIPKTGNTPRPDTVRHKAPAVKVGSIFLP